jgi:hypothetical protein
MKHLVFLLIFNLAFVGIGLAQSGHHGEPECSQAAGKRSEITNADATILEFTIGSTSLKEVKARLGEATEFRLSRDEESEVAVCYRSPKDGTVLAFYTGSMGGWKDVTGFALWSRAAGFQQKAKCAESTLVSRDLATGTKLRLGMSRKELEAVAGKSSKFSAGWASYDYVCRRKMTDAEIRGFKDGNNWDVKSDPYFDRVSWITVKFGGPTASRIDIGRFDSY